MPDSNGVVALGVSHEYSSGADQVPALVDVDLTLASGEFVVLMGVSGSGKSTLVSVLGGLLVPTSGRVTSFGVDLTACSSTERAGYRARIATVIFQEYNLFSMLTARENISTALELWGVSRGDAQARADEVLVELGLGELGDRLPGQLSGGQRQRIAIGRALAAERRLVLADEPTAAIDRATALDIRRMFRSLADRGSAVVVATHDPQFIDDADRVVELVDGRIRAAESV